MRDQNGIVTLVAAVVVFFVTLTIALSISFLGLGELQHGFTEGLSGQAFSLADGCVDEGLERLRLSSSYTGETLSVDDDSCTIVVSGSGGTRQIDVTGTVNGSITRKIRVQITIVSVAPRNTVTVTSWEELTT